MGGISAGEIVQQEISKVCGRKRKEEEGRERDQRDGGRKARTGNEEG